MYAFVPTWRFGKSVMSWQGLPSAPPRRIKLTFLDRKALVGFFDPTDQSGALEKENKYTFVEMNNSGKYRDTRDMRYVTIVEGDLLQKVEYPAKEQLGN